MTLDVFDFTAELASASALAAALAYAMAALVRARAERLGLVQAPTARSSHVRPTPHGGGLGIAMAGFLASLALGAIYGAPDAWWVGAAAAIGLALVGLLDDLRNLTPGLRLSAQALACWAAAAMVAPPPLVFAPGWVLAGLPLTALLALALIWWTNLFNFMDGIDGIAASQAAFMAGAALTLILGRGLGAHEPALLLALGAIAGACLGFLVLNWPPARVFMGDVGSLYLGFAIAYLGLETIRAGLLDYPVWAILGALFITDATVTLARRWRRGERLHQAHRSHAYQRLSRRWGGHLPVTALAIAINLIWLAPLAAAAAAWPQAAWALTALAYAPLALGAYVAGAGRADNG